MKRITTIIATMAFLSGCASSSKNIDASYVSPILYQSLTCDQLRAEAQNISQRALIAAGAQDKKAGSDAAVMTVGLVLFWPALFFTNGDGASAAEVARLKGEMQAIETASNRKNCGIVFKKEPPKKTAPKSNYP